MLRFNNLFNLTASSLILEQQQEIQVKLAWLENNSGTREEVIGPFDDTRNIRLKQFKNGSSPYTVLSYLRRYPVLTKPEGAYYVS